MSTPFWLNKNRNDISLNSLLSDQRDLARTYCNGDLLLDLLLYDLKMHNTSMNRAEQVVYVGEKASVRHLIALLKRELLSEWHDKHIEKLIRILYKLELNWTATQALIKNTDGAEAGFLILETDLSSRVSIRNNGDGIEFKETADLMKLRKFNGFGIGSVENQDNSPIISAENNFRLTLCDSDQMEFEKQGSQIQLNGQVAETHYSKRFLMKYMNQLFHLICQKGGISERNLDLHKQHTFSSP